MESSSDGEKESPMPVARTDKRETPGAFSDIDPESSANKVLKDI